MPLTRKRRDQTCLGRICGADEYRAEGKGESSQSIGEDMSLEKIEQLKLWWDHLIARLLSQEEVEDYYYEYRIDAGRGESTRYIVRLHPVWWTVQKSRWEDMRKLCEKGYTLFHEEQEPVYMAGWYGGEEESYALERFFEGMWLAMVLYSVAVPLSEAEWMCSILRECGRTEIEGMKFKEDRIFWLTLAVVDLQGSPAGLKQQEEWLGRLRERLPELYYMIFGEGNFWYSVNRLPESMKDLGLPSFALVERWLEYYEFADSFGEQELPGRTLWRDRGERWQRAMEQSILQIPVALAGILAADSLPGEWRQEMEELFEKMAVFFRGYCTEDLIRGIYERVLCETAEQIRKLPEGAAMSEADRKWLGRWEKRLGEELGAIREDGEAE